MSLLSDWKEFLHECSICKQLRYEGDFLVYGGPWLYFVCLECNEWLDQIERHNYDLDEGPK